MNRNAIIIYIVFVALLIIAAIIYGGRQNASVIPDGAASNATGIERL